MPPSLSSWFCWCEGLSSEESGSRGILFYFLKMREIGAHSSMSARYRKKREQLKEQIPEDVGRYGI